MNYWKLGCNWGRGMPDFYSLLKEKRIVICGDSSMAKGDWVLICQGHDAVALAKIGSVPAPSTARADLQADFERLQTTYDESNSVAGCRGVRRADGIGMVPVSTTAGDLPKPRIEE